MTREQLRAAIFERRTAEGPGVVPGLSAQSCGIFDKVWEADRFVRVARRAEWTFEVHPELCFQRMQGAGLASKKTARGALQRLALVRAHFRDAEDRMREVDHGAVDDLLDAYAALWTAKRIADLGIDHVEVLGDGTRGPRCRCRCATRGPWVGQVVCRRAPSMSRFGHEPLDALAASTRRACRAAPSRPAPASAGR